MTLLSQIQVSGRVPCPTKYTSTVAEEYWTAIRDVNMENNIGLTTAEVNRKTRLSADLTTLVTTMSPI